MLVVGVKKMHVQRKILRQIADSLNQRGIVGKRGGKYHASTIKAVVAKSMYA